MQSNSKSMSVLEEFSMKALKNETPKKAAKVKSENTKLVPIITSSRKKTVFNQLEFDEREFSVRTVGYIQNIEEHMILIETKM